MGATLGGDRGGAGNRNGAEDTEGRNDGRRTVLAEKNWLDALCCHRMARGRGKQDTEWG